MKQEASMIWRVAKWAAGLAAMALLIAGPLSSAKADKLQDVLDRGYVIIGTSSTNPPFGFKDESGNLVGFDIEVSKLIAEALFGDPTKVKFELMSLEGRWSAIQTDKVDAIVMITTILPDRLKRVAFTPAYIDSGMAVITRKDSGIKTLADLDKEDVTVSTLTVPYQIEPIEKFAPKATVASFEAVDQQFLALKSGRAQAMEVDLPVGMWYAGSDPDITLVPELFSGYQNYAIAYKLGELSWSQFLNGFVTELTHGSLYFEYEALYQEWFKTAPPPQRSYTIKAAE
jgi:polar amino acid transport system substrate-binding protein